jgi:hypothetical protein
MANLNLEWEQVDEAAAYEIKLTPKEPGRKGQEESLIFKTETPSFSGRVPTGVYKLQVRSKDKTSGYFGKWSQAAEIEVVSKVIELLEPRNEAVVANAKSRRSSVMFQWTPVAEARAYTLKLWSDDPTKVYEFQSRTPTLSLNLITGREYHWQVTFESKARIGYHASPQVFAFKLLGPQLLMPVIDEKLGLPVVESLQWSASPEAQYYEGKLFRHALDETAWEPYRELPKSEATRWTFTKLPPGVYRVEVVAHASHRVSSEAGVIEFVVKPTVTDLESALQAAMQFAGAGANPVLAPIKSEERQSKAEPEDPEAGKAESKKKSAPQSHAPKAAEHHEPATTADPRKGESPEAKDQTPSSSGSSPSEPPSSEDDLSLDDLDN